MKAKVVGTTLGGYGGFGVSGTATGNISLAIKPNSVSMSRSGSISGSVQANFGVWKPSAGISAGFGIDSNGFRFQLPLIGEELKLSW